MTKYMHTKANILCQYQFNYKYLNQLFEEHKEYKKFAMILDTLIHHGVRYAENLDNDTETFLREFSTSPHGKNTAVFVLGDHGLRTGRARSTLQGKLEERLPFLALMLPPRFRSHRAEMENLRRNSHILTSHFDLYATLQHLRTFPHLNSKVGATKFGASLFTDIGRLNRTCEDAGVEKHWCPCLNFQTVDWRNDKNVGLLASRLIEFINKRNEGTVPGKCEVLKLQRIWRAGRRTPNTEVNQFTGTKTKKGSCDSCDVQYDKSKNFTRYLYEVNFSLRPGGGRFEGNGVVYLGGGGIVIDEQISRTNLYGDQPKCISEQFPHLRAFCYCKTMST